MASAPSGLQPVRQGTPAGPFPRALVAALAFALVLVAGGAAIFMSVRSTDTDRLVSHTFEVRQVLIRLLSEMQDAETGQRGYLLTLDENYLQPFTQSETSGPMTLARLRELIADNAEQTARLDKLVPLVDERREIIRRTIELARLGNSSAAIEIVKGGRGKEIMDGIRADIATMSDAERDLLIARQKDAATARTSLLALICLSLIAALALAGVLARTAIRAINDERQRSAELQAEATLRREAEDTLRQAQKIEAVGQLTGGIAHDFNNLLTIIIGNLDTLRRRLNGAPPDTGGLVATLMKPVDLALQGAQNAAQLTHRLLAFSRRQTLNPARIDLNRLISGMSDLLRRTLGETIAVETILAAGLWPTFADTNQIENALINLCVNSRDAMPDGGHLTIETANTFLDDAYARQFGDILPGQYVLLSVTDTGSGISPESLARAFEPFFTTKPAGQGSGLGLAMVHGFVKQSGGHVRIYSEMSHGTTVKIYLPRMQQEEMAATPAARAAATANPRAGASETILVVEDNDGVRQFAKDSLQELGYTVLEAADAEVGLQLLESAPRIDLLFTDVVLPGMSGRELANRALARRPDLPVLFTTGYTRNAIIHHGRLDPGVHLLSKPFAQDDLARKVRELLDGHGPH
jgi:signal transduction histidine kinase